MCQTSLARHDPTLVRILGKKISFGLETWVAMHGDLRASPRCKVVFDALVEGLVAYASGRPRRG